MHAGVSLNLLNELRNIDKMRCLPSIFSFFAKIDSKIQEHECKVNILKFRTLVAWQ